MFFYLIKKFVYVIKKVLCVQTTNNWEIGTSQKKLDFVIYLLFS